MNKKSFFLGAVSGIVLTLVILFVIGLVRMKLSEKNSPVHLLENPVSYENKEEAYFQVFQVHDGAALAREISDVDLAYFNLPGNVVVLLGDNFYTNQVVTVKNPQRIGTYSYTSKQDIPMTVPVIDGEIE